MQQFKNAKTNDWFTLFVMHWRLRVFDFHLYPSLPHSLLDKPTTNVKIIFES